MKQTLITPKAGAIHIAKGSRMPVTDRTCYTVLKPAANTP